eukprot:CFRG3505T1
MVRSASIGRLVLEDEDPSTQFAYVREQGLNFVLCSLTNARWRQDVAEAIGNATEPPALALNHVRVTEADVKTNVVGLVSPWINLHSHTQAVRESFELTMKRELMWAEHLGLPAVLLPSPTPTMDMSEQVNYARFINCHLAGQTSAQYWLRVPIRSEDVHASKDTQIDIDNEDWESVERPWRIWNQFRSLCDHSIKLNACLELTEDLPFSMNAVERWAGEPVKAIMIDTKLFMTNSKGYPVLSARHQDIIRRFVSFDVQWVVTGRMQHKDGIDAYVRYLQHVNDKTRSSEDFAEYDGNGYEDYLQAPLQPLMNNLESGIYAVFEQDPVKYREYQEAVYRALCDRVPEQKKGAVTTVIMVVGAGRGPLVRGCLMAAQRADRKIKLYAIEKNPNAIITLQGWKADVWGDTVTIHSGDMRDFKPAEKCDILVSELLGSFGDNELSPECLDGAQMYLKDDGISIPSQYVSFAAPVSSQKLFNEVKTRQGDMPYVVLMHNHTRIAAPQPLFTFNHPNKDAVIDNRRYGSMSFTAGEAHLMHGIGGYFETTLYKDVFLSINPTTHSPGMFSWFPIYFPLPYPINVQSGETITIHFWRCIDHTRVWYEWAVSSPVSTPIQNVGARTYHIGL